MYTRTFIAKEIQPMVESNPEIPLTSIQDVIQKKHQIQVSLHKVSKAKKLAKQKIHGAETMFKAIKVEASQLKVVMVDATKYQEVGIDWDAM
ncbi:hypothetical protein QVD17_09030 [Tagetes erecta]|uniref:Uncharacterized protein n=1 Tax=Tagetes erecta TaxID=13708 RepID=A0AAD8P3J7_TARER|nr:hypothetical protein QVD17_09030 [Tagetes erecta]